MGLESRLESSHESTPLEYKLYEGACYNEVAVYFKIFYFSGKRERGWFPRKCGVKTSICEDEPHNGAHVTNGSAPPSPLTENNAIGDHSDVQQVRTNAKKNKWSSVVLISSNRPIRDRLSQIGQPTTPGNSSDVIPRDDESQYKLFLE